MKAQILGLVLGLFQVAWAADVNQPTTDPSYNPYKLRVDHEFRILNPDDPQTPYNKDDFRRLYQWHYSKVRHDILNTRNWRLKLEWKEVFKNTGVDRRTIIVEEISSRDKFNRLLAHDNRLVGLSLRRALQALDAFSSLDKAADFRRGDCYFLRVVKYTLPGEERALGHEVIVDRVNNEGDGEGKLVFSAFYNRLNRPLVSRIVLDRNDPKVARDPYNWIGEEGLQDSVMLNLFSSIIGEKKSKSISRGDLFSHVRSSVFKTKHRDKVLNMVIVNKSLMLDSMKEKLEGLNLVGEKLVARLLRNDEVIGHYVDVTVKEGNRHRRLIKLFDGRGFFHSTVELATKVLQDRALQVAKNIYQAIDNYEGKATKQNVKDAFLGYSNVSVTTDWKTVPKPYLNTLLKAFKINSLDNPGRVFAYASFYFKSTANKKAHIIFYRPDGNFLFNKGPLVVKNPKYELPPPTNTRVFVTLKQFKTKAIAWAKRKNGDQKVLLDDFERFIRKKFNGVAYLPIGNWRAQRGKTRDLLRKNRVLAVLSKLESQSVAFNIKSTLVDGKFKWHQEDLDAVPYENQFFRAWCIVDKFKTVQGYVLHYPVDKFDQFVRLQFFDANGVFAGKIEGPRVRFKYGEEGK